MKQVNRILCILAAISVLLVSLPISSFASAQEDGYENLLQNGSMDSAKAILMTIQDHSQIGNATGNRVSEAGIQDIVNGKESGYTYVMDAFGWDVPRYVGLTFALNGSYYIDSVSIDGGYEDRAEIYDIYVSENEAELYQNSSLAATGVECLNGKTTAKIKQNGRYVAVVCTSCKDGGMRIKKMEVTGGETAQVFKPENLLKSENLTSSGAILMAVNDHSQIGNALGNRVSEAGLQDIINGKASGYTYVMDALGWDVPRYVGFTFGFDDSYYIGEVLIDGGYEDRAETYDVYVADSESALYLDESLTATGVEALNGEIAAKIGKWGKYVAVVCTSCKDGGMRIKQIKVLTGEDDNKPFTPENALQTMLENAQGVNMFLSTGATEQSTRFDENGAITASTDGDLSTHADVYGALDWNPPRYIGVLYTLTESVFAGEAVIYSGYEEYPDTYRIYAGNSIENLYTEANCVADGIVCDGTRQAVTLNQEIRYIAFFCTAYEGNQRLKELEVWTAEPVEPGPGEEPENPYDTTVAEGGKKVLTIGNSFSENASAYATAIAADQGYDLLFGYLKYPSCTIDQHVEFANYNRAVYRFEYTGSKGRFTVKDGEKTFATMQEALKFTDWDIVVLQQGSTASEDITTYLKITDLAAYVKQFCPNATLMLHETWSWGIWDVENYDRFDRILANYYVAANHLLDGVPIIHSGLDIRLAREQAKDPFKFSDYDDGKYQHLNAYGKYLAGAAYVKAIFGCKLAENTFGDGDSTFDGIDLDAMRAIVDANDEYDALVQQYIDEIVKALNAEPDNFFYRHGSFASGLIQDVATGAVSDSDRFEEAARRDFGTDGSALAIDGDVLTSFDVWGALDWDPPRYVGVRYGLDGVYRIDRAWIWAGKPNETVTFNVYAAKVGGAMLFKEENLIAKNVVCSGSKVAVPIGAEISEIAFVITAFENKGNSPNLYEFNLEGSENAVVVEKKVWPAMPAGENLLKKATVFKIAAPGGDYRSTKEYEYRFMDYKTETDLSKLVDGDLSKHYDLWSLRENDKPGMLYDLGAYYDLSHVHAWVGVKDSDMYIVNGFRVYASDALSTLYQEKNLVFSYEDQNDTTNEMGANLNVKRVRYLAILATNEEGGWKFRELGATGKLSADQSEPVERESIIAGLDAEYYGVATDNLADPTYAGASDSVVALVDGKRENVEFWGGADVQNSCFVFIYNLYGNYDLTDLEIYSFADTIDEEFHVHKGIKTAKVYAARKFADLFQTNPLVLKNGYVDESVADEESYYAANAPADWKAVRYIAFVFTIGDTRYGACRLEELKVYGKLSAVQDEEEEEAKLPQYIDITAENGVVARIFALNATDDLLKLDAHLQSTENKAEKKLAFVNEALEGYSALSLYEIAVVNTAGAPVDTNSRRIRLSLPNTDENMQVACVDDFGAEIISSGTLGEYLTVETETLRSYALVHQSDAAASVNGRIPNPLWIAVIVLGILAGCGMVFCVIAGIKLRKQS